MDLSEIADDFSLGKVRWAVFRALSIYFRAQMAHPPPLEKLARTPPMVDWNYW